MSEYIPKYPTQEGDDSNKSSSELLAETLKPIYVPQELMLAWESHLASYSRDTHELLDQVKESEAALNSQYQALLARVQKYEQMLQDITMDSNEFTMDSDVENFTGWNILAQASYWDYLLKKEITKLRDKVNGIGSRGDLVSDISNEILEGLIADNNYISNVIEALSDTPLIRELADALNTTTSSLSELQEEYVKLAQKQAADAEALANQQVEKAEQLVEAINASIAEQLDRIAQEAAIRTQLLQELEDRVNDASAQAEADVANLIAEVDSIRVGATADKASILATVDNYKTELKSDIATVNTELLGALDGVTTLVNEVRDENGLTLNELTTYKSSNDVALAGVLSKVTTNISDTAANASKIDGLTSELATTNAELGTVRNTSANALSKANTAVSANSALATRVDSLAAAITDLSEGAETAVDVYAFNALKAEVKTNAAGVTSLVEQVDALGTNYTNLADGVKANTDAVSKLTVKQSEMNGDISQLSSDVTYLTSELGVTNTALNTKASNQALSNLNTKLTTTDGKVAANTQQLTQLNSDLTTVKNGLETKASTEALNNLATEVTELEDGLAVNASAITNLKSEIDTELNKKATVTAVNGLTTKVEEVEGKTTTNANNLLALNTSVGNVVKGLANKLDASAISDYYTKSQTDDKVESVVTGKVEKFTASLKSLIDANSTAIQNTNAEVARVDGRVTATNSAQTLLEGRVQNVEGDITKKADASALASLTTRVGTVEGQYTSQASDITRLSNSLDTTNVNVGTAQSAAQNAMNAAGAKGKVIFGNTAPAVADRLIQNLWIDTTSNANTPKRWDGSAWVVVTDKVATDAANAVKDLDATVKTKADVSALNSLTTKVTDEANKTTANTNSITTLNSDIVKINNDLATKANASALNDIYTKSQADTKATEIAAGQITDFKASLKFGAKNLLKNSSSLKSVQTGGNGTITNGVFSTISNGAETYIALDTHEELDVGKYTLSVYVNSDGLDKGITVPYRVGSSSAWTHYNYYEPKTSNGWVRLNFPVNVTTKGVVRVALDNYRNTTGTLSFKMPQLERGEFLTDWSPSEVDTQTQLDANARAIETTNAEVSRVDGRVTTESNRITSLTGRVSTVEGAVATKADASALNSLTTRVTNAEGVNTSQGTAITSLQNTINHASTGLETKASSAALTAVDNKVTAVDGRVTATNSAVTNLTGRVSTVEGGLTTKADVSALNALTTRVGNVEGGLVTAANNITSLRSTIAGTVESVTANGSQATVDTIGLPAANVLLSANADSMTGSLIKLKGQVHSPVTNSKMLIDPTKLYKLRMRFRRTAGTDNRIYVAVINYNASGDRTVTNSNTLNAVGTSIDNTNYPISGELPALNVWREVEYYFKGKSTGASTGSGTLDSPRTFPALAATVDIGVLANYVKGNDLTQEYEIDYLIFEDAADSVNANAISSTNTEVSRINGVVSGHTTQLSNLTASIAGKADTSALNSLTARVEAEEGKSSSQSTSITNLKSSVADALKAVTVSDTRSTNQPPSWYWSNYARRVVNEFKTQTAIDVNGFFGGTYCNLETKVYWSDSTGGDIIQTATSSADPSLYVQRRSNGTAAWTAWVQPIKDLRDSLGTKASASAVSTLDTKVENIDGKVTTQASQILTLTSDNDANKNALQVQAKVVDGVKANYMVKMETNGVIGGFGLMQSTGALGQVQTSFGVNANSFFIGAPASKKQPFIVTTTNQVVDGITYPAGTYINSAIIANATIGTAHIADAAITNAKIKELDASKITTGTLDAKRIRIGDATHFDAGYAPTDVLNNAKAYVDSNTGNLVNNPSVYGNRERWSDGTVTIQNFLGTATPVLTLTTSRDLQVFSDAIEVDPAKAYEVSVWVKKNAAVGSTYLGLSLYDAAGSNIGINAVNQSGEAWLDTNFYHWYVSTTANPLDWVKLVAYVMPAGTNPLDMKRVGTVSTNAFMLPNTRKLQMRVLNYYNGGTATTAWFANPKIVEVDPNAVIAAAKAQILADSKTQTFTAQPTTPYAKGDIYRNGSSIYVCTTARASGSYVAADWTLVGDVTANNTSADTAKVNGVAAATVAANAANGAKVYADVMSDLKITPVEKTAINQEWNRIQKEYSSLLAQAQSLGITTTAYTAAYTGLSTTDPSMSSILSSMSTTTTLTAAERDAYKTQYTTYYTQAVAITKAINDKIAANAKADLDNLEVGGRNLLKDSALIHFKGSDSGGNGGASVVVGDFVRLTPVAAGNVWGNNAATGGLVTASELLPGEQYTYSVMVKTAMTSIGLYCYSGGNHLKYSIPLKSGNVWERVSFTFTQSTARAKNFTFLAGFHQLEAGVVVEYRSFKLEKGNKATDWTPAPEDVNATIESKSKTFTAQPAPPYTAGDLWKDGSTIKVCTVTRVSGSYVAADWTLVGDVTSANTAANSNKLGGKESSAVLNDITGAKNAADAAALKANSVDTQLTLWKYPNSTYIDGGKIYTNSITANQISTAAINTIALKAHNGTFTAADGSKTVINGGLTQVFYPNGQLAVKLGVW